MAQLRDAQTSEIVASGDARDLVLIYDEAPDGSLLWDDVPADFDPAALLAHLDEQLDGLVRTERRDEASRRREVRSVVEQVLQVASTARNADVPTMAPVDLNAE